jgi:hypothetical protein
MGMRYCRIAGYPGGQIKAAGRGPIPDEVLQDLPLRIAELANLEVNHVDIREPDEAATSWWHWKRGSSGGELEILLCFGSKIIVKSVAMRRPRFGNNYCQSTYTDAFRKQRSIM